MAPHGIPWHPMASHGNPLHPMAPHGTSNISDESQTSQTHLRHLRRISDISDASQTWRRCVLSIDRRGSLRSVGSHRLAAGRRKAATVFDVWWRLQPYSVFDGGCNRMQWRRQACAMEAATVCNGGCNRVQWRQSPCVVEAATVYSMEAATLWDGGYNPRYVCSVGSGSRVARAWR